MRPAIAPSPTVPSQREAAQLQPPATVALKDIKDWKVAGKGVKRLDTVQKLDGSLVYGIDLRLPNMLTATIRQCPVAGGKLKSFDAAKVEKMPGVRKVVAVDGTAVAVIADSYWQAHKAIDTLPVDWDLGPGAKTSSATIDAMLAEGLTAENAFVGTKIGDAKVALAGAVRTVEAVYSYPYQNHAPMEPMNATALYTADRCEVWAPTQNGEAALAAAAEAAELPVAKCDVHKMMLGGGFGRRGRSDFVRQAVLIARQMPGVPVKLIWSREEDMMHCAFHPVTQCKLTGGLDAAGNLTGLHMRISGQSILASLLPQNLQNGMDPVVFQGLNAGGAEGQFGYDIPNLLVDHAMRNPHVLAGFWRGVNLNQNAIYVECFMDELARAAGQDPLEFRRKYLKPKHRAVLDAAAAGAGYGKAAPGVHHGLAQIMGFGSYVAACAEVSVTNGKLKIHRIVAATDPGVVVNPAQVERQVSGSFVYGLSAALHGQCTVKDGVIEQTNFDTYPVPSHGRDAEGRNDPGSVGRLLGRRGRADDRRGRTGGAQRDLRRNRQTHPVAARVQARPEDRVTMKGLPRLVAAIAFAAAPASAGSYVVTGDSIELPLEGVVGDAARGRLIVASRTVGLCLLCHSGPFPEERFQGSLARRLTVRARAGMPANCGCGLSIRRAFRRTPPCRPISGPTDSRAWRRPFQESRSCRRRRSRMSWHIWRRYAKPEP